MKLCHSDKTDICSHVEDLKCLHHSTHMLKEKYNLEWNILVK